MTAARAPRSLRRLPLPKAKTSRKRVPVRRNQGERSEKSRTQILEVALRLFSHQGYRGTSMREIAEAAGVSTGNVYHHFPEKELIFDTLLEEYWKDIQDPDLPLNRTLESGAFPDNIEALGNAVRDFVASHRASIALIYVDVVEFEGSHVRKFYAQIASRFEAFLAKQAETRGIRSQLRPEVSTLSAVMMATRFYLNFFTVEILFGVPNHFGKAADQVVRETADILRYGILRDPRR
ncbi:MAG: TetR/AcrR family transcriptional regulator [Thermoanaerobaculia bacterium]|nr:TetR/AcrR family transcriptional regulator [Thermoanaerobaculia bacterium]